MAYYYVQGTERNFQLLNKGEIMSKVIKEGEIKFKDIFIFGGVLLFAIGAIFYYDGSNNTSEKITGNDIVWTDLNDTSIDFWVRNTEDIYGVQFEFEGVKFLNIIDSGYLKENEFEISHNENVVLSFSFQGKSIPPGEHQILSMNASYLNGKYNATVKNMVMAGIGGKSLEFGYYNTLKNQETLRTNQ